MPSFPYSANSNGYFNLKEIKNFKSECPKDCADTRMNLTVYMPLSFRECVQCRTFGTGEKKDTCEKDCSYFTLIKVKDRDKLPQPNDAAYPVMHCKERDANDCWFYYTYAVNNNTVKEVHVVDSLGKDTNWVCMDLAVESFLLHWNLISGAVVATLQK